VTIKAAELIAELERKGFFRVGGKGSHVKLRSAENITIIVPDHKGRDIPRGLALAILKHAGIDPASV
jgi:predicted RNA binding protein YcfA (HicA-like mRNA interferase family)